MWRFTLDAVDIPLENIALTTVTRLMTSTHQTTACVSYLEVIALVLDGDSQPYTPQFLLRVSCTCMLQLFSVLYVYIYIFIKYINLTARNHP